MVPLFMEHNQKISLPDGVSALSVPSSERRDNELIENKSHVDVAAALSESGENVSKQSASVSLWRLLFRAINQGDRLSASLLSFCKSLLMEQTSKQYLRFQTTLQPMTSSGPLTTSGHWTSWRNPFSIAAQQTRMLCMTWRLATRLLALFVDSGGDRTYWFRILVYSSEPSAHAAYNFKNHRALIVGNDTNTWPILFQARWMKRMSQVKFTYPVAVLICSRVIVHPYCVTIWISVDHSWPLSWTPVKVLVDA